MMTHAKHGEKHQNQYTSDEYRDKLYFQVPATNQVKLGVRVPAETRCFDLITCAKAQSVHADGLSNHRFICHPYLFFWYTENLKPHINVSICLNI